MQRRVSTSRRQLGSLCFARCGDDRATSDGSLFPSNFEAYSSRSEPAHPVADDVIGHFGTFSGHIAERLEAIAAALLRREPTLRMMFLGRGSREFAFGVSARMPDLADRVGAAGELDPDALVAAIRSCTLLLQPFGDGVSSRRTTVMCALACGCPVVTESGKSTDAIWIDSRAVALVPEPNPEGWVSEVSRLLRDPQARAAQAARGSDLYWRTFALHNTIAALTDAPMDAA